MTQTNPEGLEAGLRLKRDSVNLLERGDVLQFVDSGCEIPNGTLVQFRARAGRNRLHFTGYETAVNSACGWNPDRFEFIARPGVWQDWSGGAPLPVPFDWPGLMIRRRSGEELLAKGTMPHYAVHDGDTHDIIAWLIPVGEGQGSLPEAAPLSVPSRDVPDSADELQAKVAEHFDADTFREWQRDAFMWSGSAWLSGEKVAKAKERRLKGDLYAWMCRLGNHMAYWETAANEIAALSASGPSGGGGELLLRAAEVLEAISSSDAFVEPIKKKETDDDVQRGERIESLLALAGRTASGIRAALSAPGSEKGAV